jgi:hypothetical protein
MWAEQVAANETETDANNTPHALKVVYYRSVQLSDVPLLVYLFAQFTDMNRVFIIPLVIKQSTADIDMFIRRNIVYTSVYNPYGSGSYAHWTGHNIRYFIGWTVPKQHTLVTF